MTGAMWNCCHLGTFCAHHTTMHQFTVSLHSKPHTQGACVFNCNLPPALLAEWLGPFTCYCGNMGVEWTMKQRVCKQKVDNGEENSPAAPARTWTHDLSIRNLFHTNLKGMTVHTIPWDHISCEWWVWGWRHSSWPPCRSLHHWLSVCTCLGIVAVMSEHDTPLHTVEQNTGKGSQCQACP